MSKRAKNYQLQGVVDIDSKTLEILEQSIKRLLYFPVLSDSWFQTGNELEKISNISSMEISKNSESEKKSSGMGVNQSGTLWDNDKAQDSLRLLVENSKVNTIISLVKELKSLLRSSSYLDQLAACATRTGKTVEDVAEKLAHFEFDAGLLLKRLFEHVEAIQTVDLGLICEHLTSTLTAISDGRIVPDHIELRQEGLIFNYLFGLFHFIDRLNEGQIVSWCLSNNVPQVLVQIFVIRLEVYPNQVRQKILETLGAIADNENLAESQFAQDMETKQRLVLLRKECMRDLIVEYPERRPIIRPFLEIIDKYEREIKFPKKK